MAQAFQFVALGTEAEAAALDLVPVPARLTCRSCGCSAETYDARPTCPGCDGTAVELAGGDELVIESLTFAVAGT